MDAEEDRELQARARRHAALAEPVRLRIIDLLVQGDLSPTELGRRLGLPSNLLAHHLNVLEAEQLIRRDRSEGDGRRSYVRLDGRPPLESGRPRTLTARRVVFVCTANSARSQLAQALWGAASPVPAVSAGTHPAERVSPAAVDVAARNGLDLSQAVPRLVDDRLAASDLIITVCDRAHEEYPVTAVHWSVPDPVRVGTTAAFDAAFSELEDRVSRLAPLVRLAA